MAQSAPTGMTPPLLTKSATQPSRRNGDRNGREEATLAHRDKAVSSVALAPHKQAATFIPSAFLTRIGTGKTSRDYRDKQAVYSQGDAADAVFYIQNGKVKLTAVSDRGKEAVVAILQEGSFFGEGCLAGQPRRMAIATAVQRATIIRVTKEAMIGLLHQEPKFAESFVAYLLSRNIRMEEDLVDQLFNSSEKRLARLLLLLANFGKESKPIPVVAKISQETLAEMIGTTRSRVSFFMNRFRKLGFIEYNRSGMHVHSSLVSVVLHD
jgi:CRP/FNR family transcriptional regulator, cyclic AMP receptor protein